MKPNLVAQNAALSACEKAKRWQNALALLEQLPNKRLVADDVSYLVSANITQKHVNSTFRSSLIRRWCSKHVA